MRLGLLGYSAATLLTATPMASSPASAKIVEASPGRILCASAAGQYEQIDIGRFFIDNQSAVDFDFSPMRAIAAALLPPAT